MSRRVNMDLTGTTFKKRYTLKRLVGEGGMASVYLAQDRDRDVPLALKVLKPELARSQVLELFAREAKILSTLQHPNIVRFYELDQDRGYFFIVMDWVDGPDLKQELNRRERAFPFGQVSACIRNVVSALHYAHGFGLIHCDIKPSNILIKDHNHFLLTDFGIARIAGDRFEAGTPYYMAPEQFIPNGKITAQTDIYSLGIMTFELLSGGAPFTGDTAPSQAGNIRQRLQWEHFNRPMPSLRKLNPSVTGSVEDVIKVALNKDPSRRFPAVRDFRKAYEAARAGEDPGATSIVEPEPKPRTSRKVPTGVRSRNPVGPHLVIQSGQWAGRYVRIPQRGLRIGRQHGNDLRLASRSVSRQHAVIWKQGTRVFIKDRNSSLGTFINSRKIRGAFALRNGDRIRIGRIDEFQFMSK